MTEPKKTDAWMPLWIGDYLADTMSLTRDEHGAYLLLLFAYWRNKGPLKNDEKSLAATTRSTPLEWRKKLREKMEEFFEIQDGYLVHARADKELKKAGIYAMKAHDRAVKAAAARWGQKGDAPSMQQACSEHSSSNAKGVLDSCPSPSPSPSISIPTLVAKDLNYSAHTATAPDSEAPKATPAGLACKAMRAAGLQDANPSHPTLVALLNAGVTVEELAGAAADAAGKGKGFAYALKVAEGRRKDAAAIGALPTATSTSFAQKAADVARTTVPGREGRDPALVAIERDAQRAVPPPADLREKFALLRRQASPLEAK